MIKMFTFRRFFHQIHADQSNKNNLYSSGRLQADLDEVLRTGFPAGMPEQLIITGRLLKNRDQLHHLLPDFPRGRIQFPGGELPPLHIDSVKYHLVELVNQMKTHKVPAIKDPA